MLVFVFVCCFNVICFAYVVCRFVGRVRSCIHKRCLSCFVNVFFVVLLSVFVLFCRHVFCCCLLCLFVFDVGMNCCFVCVGCCFVCRACCLFVDFCVIRFVCVVCWFVGRVRFIFILVLFIMHYIVLLVCA